MWWIIGVESEQFEFIMDIIHHVGSTFDGSAMVDFRKIFFFLNVKINF